jgi:hypothetical protein
MFAGGAAKSQALAPAIAAVAARLGVAFLDAGPLVRVSATDGIHYDAAAMPALARAFAAATDRHFPALRR